MEVIVVAVVGVVASPDSDLSNLQVKLRIQNSMIGSEFRPVEMRPVWTQGTSDVDAAGRKGAVFKPAENMVQYHGRGIGIM